MRLIPKLRRICATNQQAQARFHLWVQVTTLQCPAPPCASNEPSLPHTHLPAPQCWFPTLECKSQPSPRKSLPGLAPKQGLYVLCIRIHAYFWTEWRGPGKKGREMSTTFRDAPVSSTLANVFLLKKRKEDLNPVARNFQEGKHKIFNIVNFSC